MRMESAAAAKGKDTSPRNLRPREGTKLGAMYDLLMANKGLPMTVPLTKLFCSHCGSGSLMIGQLRDFYGLDIRKLQNGGGGAPATWVLAGEWFGKTYVDYIADRIHAAERRA